jgi:hypothetical protein
MGCSCHSPQPKPLSSSTRANNTPENHAVNTSFDSSIVIRAFLLLLGLSVATFFGILIGESNWTTLSVIITIILILSIAQLTVRHLLVVCLLITGLDFWIAPTGFKMSPMEQIGVVAAFAWMLVCWRKSFNPNAVVDFLELKSWRLFQNAVFLAAAYAITHFIYNMLDPYDELAFGWKGAAKSYSQTFGAFLMIVFVARARLLFPITSKYSTGLLWLLLFTLLISVAIGVVRSFTMGAEPEVGLSMEEKIDLHRVFVIPGLNASDNVYTLRQLGPLAVLIGSMFFFSRPRNLPPFLPIAILALGFVGCLLSGGRASVVFAGAFLMIAMIRSRQTLLAMGVGAILAVAFSILLILPASVLREAPWHFQRSVGWFRPDLRTHATEGIKGSSDMRLDLFKFAWNHYISGDSRLILFGRSVGQMDNTDVLSFLLYNELATMEFAVRRLTTHNGMTDFLLGWGLFGYLLNIAMCIFCIRFLFHYLKLFQHKSHGECWIFCAAIFMGFWLVYNHVGGSFIWPISIVLVLVALAQRDGLTLRRNSPDLGEEVEPTLVTSESRH